MKNFDRIILIDKPAGISSFGVVARVRRQLTEEKRADEIASGIPRENLIKRIKVGHTGTLDPFATGLLILLSGKRTREAEKFSKLDKEYVATIRLGATSTTGDPEGEIKFCHSGLGQSVRNEHSESIGEIPPDYDQPSEHRTGARLSLQGAAQSSSPRPLPTAQPLSVDHSRPSLTEIENLIKEKFTGEITQTPPIYSAIKIGGERAYKLARKNEKIRAQNAENSGLKSPELFEQKINIPPRQVTIYSLEVLNYSFPFLKIRAHVSSGTYIRTLAEDIGKMLKTGAYTTQLRRVKVGQFDVHDAAKLQI